MVMPLKRRYQFLPTTMMMRPTAPITQRPAVWPMTDAEMSVTLLLPFWSVAAWPASTITLNANVA